MPHADFVHLRVHSSYSLSEGAIKADKIAALARDAGMPAVAITDTGNLFGALEFSQACAAHGVQPIIGCQIAHRARGQCARSPPDPVVLLAQDADRLRQSAAPFLARIPGDRSRPEAAIAAGRVSAEHAAGLLLLTGGTHGSARAAAGGGPEAGGGGAARATRRGVPRSHGDGAAPPRPAGGKGDRARPDRAGRRRAACRWSPPTIVSSPSPRCTRRTTPCCASPRGGCCPKRDRRRVTPEHWFKPARGDARAVRRSAGSLRQHAGDRAALRGDGGDPQAAAAGLPEGARRAAPRTRRCAPWRARAWSAAWTRSAPTRRTRAKYASGWNTSSTSSPAWVPRLFPHRRRFHPVGEGAGDSGRAGPRVGRRVGGGVGADDHRSRSAAVQSAVRALPQSRTHLDAGFRHRFLPGPARRGDRLCARANTAPTGWRRSSPSANCRRGRRCAMSGRVLGLPFGQVNKVAELIPNNPAKPVTLQQAIDGEPQAAADARRRRGHRAADGNRAAARGAVPPRQHPCRRRGDRRPAR